MKFLLTIVCVLSLSSAFAFNDVECEDWNRKVTFEVSAFPSGSYFKDAKLSMEINGSDVFWKLIVNRYFTPGLNRVQYLCTNCNTDLQVDFWPDPRPRWGRSYTGILRSNQGNFSMRCRFPSAN